MSMHIFSLLFPVNRCTSSYIYISYYTVNAVYYCTSFAPRRINFPIYRTYVSRPRIKSNPNALIAVRMVLYAGSARSLVHRACAMYCQNYITRNTRLSSHCIHSSNAQATTRSFLFVPVCSICY